MRWRVDNGERDMVRRVGDEAKVKSCEVGGGRSPDWVVGVG
jgi:hypothetical protein